MEAQQGEGRQTRSAAACRCPHLPGAVRALRFPSQAIELRGARWIGLDPRPVVHDPYYVTPHPHGRVAVLGEQDDAADRDPAQQRTTMFMPLMFMVSSRGRRAQPGAVWLISNLWTIRPAGLDEPLAGQRQAGKGALIGTCRRRRERCDRNCTERVKCFRRAGGRGAWASMLPSRRRTSKNGSVRVDVQGEEGELLLRRRGERLDALQHLVEQRDRCDVGRDQRIVIDAMDSVRGRTSSCSRWASS